MIIQFTTTLNKEQKIHMIGLFLREPSHRYENTVTMETHLQCFPGPHYWKCFH